MKRLAVLGASGHGKVVADCAELCGWNSIFFFDDSWPDKQGNGAWSVVGDSASLFSRVDEFDGVVVAIGNNKAREKKLKDLGERGAPLISLIHPSALVSRYASIDAGSVVFAGVVINANCYVGRGAIINTGSTVDHDCMLGNSVHVSPGAHVAGGVYIGDRSWLGIGSSVNQLVRIGADVIIGSGAAVVCDIPDNCVAVGIPARVRQ